MTTPNAAEREIGARYAGSYLLAVRDAAKSGDKLLFDEAMKAAEEVVTHLLADRREACARKAEDAPDKVLHFYDRPGSPPGNAYVPLRGKHIAEALRQMED